MVDSDIRSGKVPVHAVNPPQTHNPIHWGSPFKTWQCTQWRERERELESAEAYSMAIISRPSSAPLPWVQWLRGKSVRLSNQKVPGLIPSWIPVDFSLHLCSIFKW